MKPRCTRVIVVEGKYDKIRVESCLDATVFPTDGFGIFKNDALCDLLRRLAREKGLVILTDSDGGGRVIRSFLSTLTGGEGVVHLYIPPVKGKEKRKIAPGKAGLLGVEGTDCDVLIQLFRKAGLLEENAKEPQPRYTTADLFRLGYTGKEGSAQRRSELLRQNGLPEDLSTGAFLDVIRLLEIPL